MNLIHRPRRLRKNEKIRELIKENAVSTKDLIFPLFVIQGNGIKEEIPSMPGIYRFSIDNLEAEIEEISLLGLGGIILFGIPKRKDETGSEAYSDNGVVQEAVRKIKKINSSLLVITDVCLCEYTSHGHCGIVEDMKVSNDKTLEYLAKVALSHADAGADIIAPSDMMDGRVRRIRGALDNNGYEMISIMSYSAKYASNFYSPFRDAAMSEPKFGDRKSYQMSYANSDEAIREIKLDIDEGADIIMIKPALSYLDIIRRAKDNFNVPIAAYNVSGEYAMVKAASRAGWLDEKEVMMEVLTSIKRAGARIIITYFAKEFAAINC